jgi:hypothetical protein
MRRVACMPKPSPMHGDKATFCMLIRQLGERLAVLSAK